MTQAKPEPLAIIQTTDHETANLPYRSLEFPSFAQGYAKYFVFRQSLYSIGIGQAAASLVFGAIYLFGKPENLTAEEIKNWAKAFLFTWGLASLAAHAYLINLAKEQHNESYLIEIARYLGGAFIFCLKAKSAMETVAANIKTDPPGSSLIGEVEGIKRGIEGLMEMINRTFESPWTSREKQIEIVEKNMPQIAELGRRLADFISSVNKVGEESFSNPKAVSDALISLPDLMMGLTASIEKISDNLLDINKTR